MDDLIGLNTWVLALSFLCSLVFGSLSQRTHFCTMGALGDWFNIGDSSRLRQWVLAMGVAMMGFASLVGFELVDPTQTLFATNKFMPLSAALGGFMFGWGMVLASGCAGKTLVRIGAGNLKSLVVAVFMGIAAFATLKGLTAVWRVSTVDQVFWDLPTLSNLPHIAAWITDASTKTWTVGLGLICGLALAIGALTQRTIWTFNHLLAGVGVGSLVVAMWWVTGYVGFVAEHPDTLQPAFTGTNSGRAESLSFVAPTAYALDWLMFYSDQSKVLTVGVVSAAGVVLGSALVAWRTHTFRWEGFGGVEDVFNHLWGAVFMGIGGVTAMGCTIGQGISGVSTLNLSSFVVLLFVVLGAKSAFAYQYWRIESSA